MTAEKKSINITESKIDSKTDIRTIISAKYSEVEVTDAGHLSVPVGLLVEVMLDLKTSFGFDYLTNLTAVDYLDHFNVIYNPCITSTAEMLHIIVKVDRNNPQIPSMVPIWGGALWQERETYDLVGIVFTNHPDLRRILLDYAWEGHPLRRDYQWAGGRE